MTLPPPCQQCDERLKKITGVTCDKYIQNNPTCGFIRWEYERLSTILATLATQCRALRANQEAELKPIRDELTLIENKYKPQLHELGTQLATTARAFGDIKKKADSMGLAATVRDWMNIVGDSTIPRVELIEYINKHNVTNLCDLKLVTNTNKPVEIRTMEYRNPQGNQLFFVDGIAQISPPILELNTIQVEYLFRRDRYVAGGIANPRTRKTFRYSPSNYRNIYCVLPQLKGC